MCEEEGDYMQVCEDVFVEIPVLEVQILQADGVCVFGSVPKEPSSPSPLVYPQPELDRLNAYVCVCVQIQSFCMYVTDRADGPMCCYCLPCRRWPGGCG